MLPILVVPAITYVIYRFSADSRASKDRIKKSEMEESYQRKLVSVFEELEHEMENAAANVIDSNEGEPYPVIKSKSHPVVTLKQKMMARWLNQLPFQKKLAFFPYVRNSHAMIICRDLRRFHQHELGRSVVRYWADHFVF
jgi:hypothetical protein